MRCPSCDHANRPDATFCEECAAALARRCTRCGVALRPTAKFCDACGTALAAGPGEEAGARKVVTIVFADLVGSTALHERLDAEAARRFVERYYEAMRVAVQAGGGTVAKLLGDGVMAVFGVPRVGEDDALRAVRAAVAMQAAFRALAEEQGGLVGATGLRVAVNTGEVVAQDATEVIGDPVNVAARLQEQGRDGDVVIGEATQRLVATRVTLAPLGRVVLKGRTGAVRAYRVVSLAPPASATTAAFVGREDELARLTAVYEAAAAAPAARLAVLLGSPGLGKSRLIAELTRRLGGAVAVLAAHCDPAGGATFAPLARALREHLGIDDGARGKALRAALAAAVPGTDADRPRVLDGIAALLTGSPAAPEETFFVVRRLLAALATAKPVLLAIDDLQWAEPLLLDLVEHLVQWGSGVPLFLLGGARPELRATRASLVAAGGLVTEVVTLAGLDAGAATRLAANVIGAADLPAAVAAKVLATSEGNPLFVGELVRMLVHEGALRREGERWIVGAGLGAIEIPPTIHALLAARLERLRPDERHVLERAAVVGRQFSRSTVAALLPREDADLDARLEALRRSELIEPDTGWVLGEPALRFHHVLIRDAAYRRLLKGTRAELHARLADWIEAHAGGAVEHDETIGWHLEQAHRHRCELGPLDDAGRSLGARASGRLAAAGRRALARDDLPLAAQLLGRALDRLESDDPARADLALDWCEALLAAGDVATAAGAIAELGRFAAGSERLRAWHACFASQRTALTAPQALRDAAGTVAAAASTLAALGDAAGEAKAHAVHAQTLARLGQVGAAEVALDRALAAARRAGDRRRANAVLAGAPLAALWGPSPVTRASGRCLDVVRVLRITQGAPAVEAVALSCQGVLEALRGRTEAARRMIASARHMVEELGITHRLLEADVFAARVALLEGDAVAAGRLLRNAYAGLRDLGLGIDAAQAAALLARALLARDRPAEAEALSHESEALAGDDLQAAIAWRGARAEALARRGEHAAAVELAEAAVAIAAATDALLDHADARLALAAALRASGRGREADAEERRAAALWEAKGATRLTERMGRRGRSNPPDAPSDVAAAAATSGPPPGHVVPPGPVEGTGGPNAASAAGNVDARVDVALAAGDADALTAAAARSRRRVRPNAATANAARYDAVVAARESAAFPALLAGDLSTVHHPTAVTFDLAGTLTLGRALFEDPTLRLAHEPLATLGDSLALCWMSWSARGVSGSRFDFGPYEQQVIILLEVDGAGRRRREEIFATDHLGAAVTRLYERHAELLTNGPARTRAAATARAVGMMLTQSADFDASVFAPSLALVDHRRVGYGTLRDAEAMTRAQAAWRDLAAGFRICVDDVLAVSPTALVRTTTASGVWRESGGKLERRVCALSVFGPDGLVVRHETFDAEQEADALARFEALAGAREGAPVAGAPPEPGVPPEPAVNDASRAFRAFARCWRARDWDGVRAAYDPAHRMDDRRRLMRIVIAGDAFFANERLLFDDTASDWQGDLRATRDERLALLQVRFTATVAGSGPMEVEMLDLIEVDAAGRRTTLVVFDPDERDAAYAELDARYEAGRGGAAERCWAAHRTFVRAIASREWEPVVTLCAPTFVERDHRRIAARETTRGAAAWAQSFSARVDLAPEALHRTDHFRAGARGFCSMGAWHGSREGGDDAIPLVAVIELDDRDRIARADIYDPDQLDQAHARFAELDARAPAAAPLANAATQALHRGLAAWEARDWEEFAALFAADFRGSDRRALVRLELDREQWLASYRALVEMTSARPERAVLATRGERLALLRVTWEGAEGPIGRSEIEWLLVVEVDGRGDHSAVVTFDPSDLDAAYAELDRRFERDRATPDAHGSAGGAGPQPGPLPASATPTAATAALDRFHAAYGSRLDPGDWDAVRATCAPGLIFEDRQRRSLLSGDRELMVASLRERVAMGARLERRLLGTAGDRVVVERMLWSGGPSDGRFEIDYLVVAEIDQSGLLTAIVLFDPDDARAAQRDAWARWRAIDPVGTESVARVSEVLDAWNDRDRARLRAAHTDDLVVEDRRRTGMGRVEGAEAYVDSVAALWALAPSSRLEVLGAFLAVERHGAVHAARRSGTLADGGAFQSDYLVLHTGVGRRTTRIELFEIDAADAALARLAALRRGSGSG